MKIKSCLLAFLWPAVTLYAQSSIKEVSIGDTIPEIIPLKVLNYQEPFINLNEKKSKLTILDFWDTHCLPCIKALPIMDSLQNKFGSQIRIIPVTYESEKTILRFFAESYIGKRLSLPSIVKDTVLSKFFPHKTLPHEVWINDKGVVVAITEEHYVNAKNIQEFLDGRLVRLPLKRELNSFKPDSLLIFNDNGGSTQDLLCSSIITKSLDGGLLGSASVGFHLNSKNYRVVATNLTVRQLYSFAFNIPPDRILFKNVKDKFRYYDVQKKLLNSDLAAYRKWSINNRFCYDLLMPSPPGIDSLSKKDQYKLLQSSGKGLMQQDINRYFGTLYNTHGRIETTSIKCYTIVKTKEVPIPALVDKSGSQGDTIFIINKPVTYLHEILTETFSNILDRTFIDETGLGSKPLNMYLPRASLSSLELTRHALKLFGIEILEADRPLNMLVIEESPM